MSTPFVLKLGDAKSGGMEPKGTIPDVYRAEAERLTMPFATFILEAVRGTATIQPAWCIVCRGTGRVQEVGGEFPFKSICQACRGSRIYETQEAPP